MLGMIAKQHASIIQAIKNMFCENCGNKLDEDAKFCNKCGRSTDPLNSQKTAAPRAATTTSHDAGAMRNPQPQSYLASVIRLKSKRRLYFASCLLTAAVIIFITQANYISNIFSGPRSVDSVTLENELMGGQVKDWNINLPLSSDSVYGTGWVLITNTVDENTNQVESTSTSKEYFGTLLGQHILVLENDPGQTPSGNFEGIIKPLRDDLKQGLINDFNSDPSLQNLNASGRLLPYMLSNDSIYSMDNFGYVLFAIILFAWGAILFSRRIIDMDDKKHYIYRTMKAAGYESFDKLSEDFVASQKQMNAKIGAYYLTTKFLFRESFFSFRVYPLSELHWIYKKVTTKNRSFSKSQSKYYSAVLHFKPHEQIELGGNEKQVDDCLLALATLRPGVKIGYTK